jgi:hypothetical protein
MQFPGFMPTYYTLIASLPHLPPHFDVERPPLSRPALLERLKLLSEPDTLTLRNLTEFLAWDRQPLDRTDEEFVRHYNQVRQSIHNPLVLEMVDHRIDVRTIVGALRRRRAGQPPPIGAGRLVGPIRQHWQHPQFGLQTRFPWIAQLAELLEREDAVATERLLFEITWRTWCRLAAEYTFSFEAVLLYVARWAIVERWSSMNAEAGRIRFEQLIEETLGEHASR